MCKISVIMPVYQAERYVSDAVKSVLAQSFTDFELLLIDDGSTDRSPHICDSLAAHDARIKVFHQPNGGVSAARNKGIALAKGEYISFVDADDLIAPNMLEVLYQSAREHDADISCCGLVQVDLQGVAHTQYCTGERVLVRDMEYLIGQFFVSPVYKEILYGPCNKIIRADIVKAVCFDTRFCIAEDLLFNFVCMEKAESFYLDNQGLYHYVKRKNSATTKAFSPKRFDYIYVADLLLESCRRSYPQVYPDALTWTFVHKLNMCYALRKQPDLKRQHAQFYTFCAEFCKKHKNDVWKRLGLKHKIKLMLLGK